MGTTSFHVKYDTYVIRSNGEQQYDQNEMESWGGKDFGIMTKLMHDDEAFKVEVMYLTNMMNDFVGKPYCSNQRSLRSAILLRYVEAISLNNKIIIIHWSMDWIKRF